MKKRSAIMRRIRAILFSGGVVCGGGFIIYLVLGDALWFVFGALLFGSLLILAWLFWIRAEVLIDLGDIQPLSAAKLERALIATAFLALAIWPLQYFLSSPLRAFYIYFAGALVMCALGGIFIRSIVGLLAGASLILFDVIVFRLIGVASQIDGLSASAALGLSFLTGFTLAFFNAVMFKRDRLIWTPYTLSAVFIVFLSIAGMIGLLLLRWNAWTIEKIVGIGLISSLCVIAGSVAGVYLGRVGRPFLSLWGGVWLYLKEVLKPMLGFAIGYLFIAFEFAACFGLAWRSNPMGSFKELPDRPSFWDFFYFSIVTLTTLGYGDIKPTSRLAKTLALGEAVAGITWITVVFASVIAYLQPRFSRLEMEKRHPEEVREL